MKTTIYINNILLNRLDDASVSLNITKNKIISILISKIICDKFFVPRPYKTVKYQDSCTKTRWKTLHVIFEPETYEKALVLRRNFKFSVSWFISFAIRNYIDEIIKDYKNKMDNYDQNFVYIAKMFGKIPVFITMLGLPEKKYLEKLLLQ